MIIHRVSQLTNAKHAIELPVTELHFRELLNSGRPIEQVMPHLTPAQIKFIQTGITEEEELAHAAAQEAKAAEVVIETVVDSGSLDTTYKKRR